MDVIQWFEQNPELGVAIITVSLAPIFGGIARHLFAHGEPQQGKAEKITPDMRAALTDISAGQRLTRTEIRDLVIEVKMLRLAIQGDE